jgi:quercetin dioxygenase-like cupin family protein
MKRQSALVATACAAALTAAVVTSGSAAAKGPVGLTSVTLARAAAGSFLVSDPEMRFVLGAGKPTDIVLVRAELGLGGSTDWHVHDAESMVLVTQGTMTVQVARHGRCVTETVPAGRAIEHPDGPHNFLNNGTEPAVFHITYFVPAGGSPAPIPSAPPRPCA